MATSKGGRPKISDEQRDADRKGRALLALAELFIRDPTLMAGNSPAMLAARRALAERLDAFSSGRLASLDEAFGLMRNKQPSPSALYAIEHLDELLMRCVEYVDAKKAIDFVAIAEAMTREHRFGFSDAMIRDRWYDFRDLIGPAEPEAGN